jgi:ATP-binding protein involved in chromosome partitioning
MEENTTEELSEQKLRENLAGIQNTILVMSGKGGVGKTTVSVNLAFGLARDGYRVGLLDVDLHGPNIAKMLGIESERVIVSDGLIEPVEVLPGLKAISLALLGYDPDRPIIWRGPLKMGAIKQLLAEVNWGELDYLIVDAPPGTGDEPLSVCQLIPRLSGAIIVTTPQDVATLDSRKSIFFTNELKVPLIGVVENMSGFHCPHCGKDVDLFGKGGGEKIATALNVPFLGALPLTSGLATLADQGKPFIQHMKDTPVQAGMDSVLAGVLDFIAARRKRD